MKLALGCLLCGLAVACAGSKPPPPVIETQEADLDPPSSPPSSKGPEKDTAEKGDVTSVEAGKKPSTTATSTPTVTLLEAGAEPRKELRHTFVNGARQKLKMNAKTSVSGAGAGMPTLAMTGPIDTQITEVKAGNARFKLTAGPFKTSTSGGSGMASAMGSLLGGAAPQKISGWGILSPEGVMVEFHVAEGGAMGQEAPVETGDPFPTEPVGKGARWEVKQLLQEKDGQVEQVSTYTLLKADKKQVQTEVRRVQTPLNPDAPGGAAESSGELTFVFGAIYPTGKLSMTRKMSIDLPGLDAAGFQMSSDVTIQKR
jgi:hypothetical protein